MNNEKLAGKSKKLARKANKMVKNAANNDINKISNEWASAIPQSKSSKMFENAKKIGSSLAAAGSQMQMYNDMAAAGTGNQVGYVGHRLTNPARTRQVIANINKRRYGGAIG